MINKKDYKKIGPFKGWVLQNFPFIEADFDAITEYQLYCKIVEYLNKVIYNELLMEESNNELVDAFNNLKTYVDNYFNNLDLQEEVNNKLDKMVEDGTFDTIINETLFNQLNNDINTLKQDVININNNFNNYTTKIERLRKKFYDKYSTFIPPFTLYQFLKDNITILQSNDLKNYKYYLNFDKKVGGNTYYISPNGNDSNDGLSRENAWRTLTRIINLTTEGDTVIIESGNYFRTMLPTINNPLYHSVNIIGEGKVNLIMGNELTYTQNSQYTNVYQAERTNVTKVVGFHDNLYFTMTPVYDIETVNNTINSYYTDGTTVYINNGGVVNNDNTFVLVSSGSPTMYIKPNDNGNDIYVYLENLTLLGGNNSTLSINVADVGTNKSNVYAKNCNFLYGGNVANNENVVDVNSSNIILEKCKICYGLKDGVNYKYRRTNVYATGIEIDCVASNNGVGGDNTNNGTTAHGGSQVIRINGNYFNNGGVNVGDIHALTKSININCNAYDSLSSSDNLSVDFGSLESETRMYLYNCYCKGSNSKTNLTASGNSIIYNSNSEYDTSSGNIQNI